jgi:predicted alpha/beta-hydrolase family hydrolase
MSAADGEPRPQSIEAEPGHATSTLEYRAGRKAPVLVLAHGAGAGQRNAFIVQTARALQERGVTVVTFDFLYISEGRKAPDRAPRLEQTWRGVLAHVMAHTGGPVTIGGKSMGGRIATHILTDPDHPARGIAGVVLLGYPLHPPGRPDQLRDAHLPRLRVPTLVVQGSADEFGTEEEVRRAFGKAPGPIEWLIVPGGNHSFKTPRAMGEPHAATMNRIHDSVAQFVHAVAKR